MPDNHHIGAPVRRITDRSKTSFRLQLSGLLCALGLAVAFALGGCGDTPTVQNTPVTTQQNTTNNTPPTVVVAAATETPVPIPTLDPVQIAAATQTAGVASAGSGPTSQNYFYADATSHSVASFGDVFTELGGVPALGFPITEPFVEQSSADGNWYWVQYFEKAVVEHHPADSASPFQLTPLGVWSFNQKYAGGTPPAKPVPGKETYTFAETNHTVKGLFLAYWKNNGEVKRFGYPISESFEEKNEATGKTYTVQYFERVEMEYHPELKSGNQVQLAALGSMKQGQVYAGGAPMGASNPVPSPTVNAEATAVAQRNATATAEKAKANAAATVETAHANATSTSLAKKASANATATAKAFESFKNKAPGGDFEQRGVIAMWCGYLEYRRSFGYSNASKNAKFLTMSASITNHTGDTLYVNPNDFTIVGIDGYSDGYDSSTFSFERPFPSVQLEPEAYAAGGLSFLVPIDFVPAKLVWRGFLNGDVTVTIVDAP